MANVPISNLTTTWNNVSTTFTGIKLNVTNTASATASSLIDLQIGGVSAFVVNKSTASASSGLDITGGVGSVFLKNLARGSDSGFVDIKNSVVLGRGGSNTFIADTGYATLFSTSVYFDLGNNGTIVRSDAANTVAQRNGVNAQTHRIYGTYTDASNYRRLTKTMSTGGVAEVKPEGAGTGASGNVLHISGLPTSNPGPGILWNNLGVVNVGT